MRSHYSTVARSVWPLTLFALGMTLSLLPLNAAWAQGFDSGSDGSDGALSFAPGAGVVVFDPTALGIDADGDRVFNFTTITIPAGTTVRLRADVLAEAKPIVWLAAGEVQIDGVVDASGDSGHPNTGPKTRTLAGAGGYGGGQGGSLPRPEAGNGPGGGKTDLAPGLPFPIAAGGGHVVAGGAGNQPSGGASYGNKFLLPITGGSGGGGGETNSAFPSATTGGGGGGGALLIASSTRITINGTVDADGGDGGPIVSGGAGLGGGGSGGGIRLIAPQIEGTGSIFARGGRSFDISNIGGGAPGRVRIEAFNYLGPLSVDPTPAVASPGPVFPPASAPRIRVVTVNGAAVAAEPTGSFVPPDAVISSVGGVTIVLEANNIPLGTVLTLTIANETGADVTVNSTPLVGTFETSAASATATFESGFSRLFVKATWTP